MTFSLSCTFTTRYHSDRGHNKRSVFAARVAYVMWEHQTTESRQQVPADASYIKTFTYRCYSRGACSSSTSLTPNFRCVTIMYACLLLRIPLRVPRARDARDKKQPNSVQQQQPQRPRYPLEAARLVRSSAYDAAYTSFVVEAHKQNLKQRRQILSRCTIYIAFVPTGFTFSLK